MVDQNATALFNDIYDSTNKKILIYITAKCNNTNDIKDIFQDTYMELYSVLVKRGPGYIENSEAFVTKIAKQKIYRYYSFLDKVKLMFSNSVTDESGDDANAPANVAANEDDSFCLDDIISEKDLIARVNEFISKKPEDIKKIFYLFYYLNLTIPEIAGLLVISESNVKNKLYRTLKELRKIYQIKGECLS